MLLVSRFELVEEDAVEVFHYCGFHLSSFFLMYNFMNFRENNNVVVFPFPFHIFLPLANLWFIRSQG
jgi:hypothetical protein